jgi:hypothetical protein
VRLGQLDANAIRQQDVEHTPQQVGPARQSSRVAQFGNNGANRMSHHETRFVPALPLQKNDDSVSKA